MKIYTRTGDLGETSLLGGPRVGKDMVRIEACGAIDELNSALGLVRAEPVSEEIDGILCRVQNELFELGAELASPDPVKQGTRTIGSPHIQRLETEIDTFLQSLPELKQFILPGGTRAAAGLHLARSICRRAERRLVAVIRHSQEEISLVLMAYLNRLGDLLFVLARLANAQANRPDILWQRPADRG
jgi:cob(I)alamin adenosyltransferase